MVRSVIADSLIEKYLENLTESEEFSYGIIIGQPTRQGKDAVIHLAKTQEDSVNYNGDNSSKNSSQSVADVKTVKGINALVLIDHALNVLRMIPGSFFVLGIFVVSPQNVFENADDFKILKTILQQLVDVLKKDNDKYGCSDEFDGGEKLILHCSGKRSLSCKSINVYDLAKAGSGKPVEWKFLEKAMQWQEIETIYDMDDTLNLRKSETENDYDIEGNFQMAIATIQQKLMNCEIFLDGEPNPVESVEHFIKQKKSRDNDLNDFIINGSIYYLCNKIEDNERVIRYNGTAKYSGIICSKVWVTSKQTMEDVQKFIKIDIMRSITDRLRMYVDAHHQTSPILLVSEPPRRVFFKLKSLPVMFSDYLFRGESNETIITQAKANLDIDLETQSLVENVEIMSDEICYEEEAVDNDIKQPVASISKKNNRFMYGVGIVFAIGILLISVGLHVLLNSNDDEN